jgi:thiamine-phosphate diphosphorylase
MTRLPRPAICFVTPGRVRSAEGQDAQDLVRLVVRAATAGANLIQIRERELPDRALLGLVGRILAEVDRSRALVVVNERADIAMAAGADGVHLRAQGVTPSRLRPIVPEGFVIGRSVHSTDEAVAAAAAGGDYLIFGTVFPSASKPANHPVAGIERLREVCASVRLPVIAIGGITTARFHEVAAAGAAGVAAIGMFVESDRAGAKAATELVQRAQRAFATESRA